MPDPTVSVLISVFFSFMHTRASVYMYVYSCCVISRMCYRQCVDPLSPGRAAAWRADGWDVILLSPSGHGGMRGGLCSPASYLNLIKPTPQRTHTSPISRAVYRDAEPVSMSTFFQLGPQAEERELVAIVNFVRCVDMLPDNMAVKTVRVTLYSKVNIFTIN